MAEPPQSISFLAGPVEYIANPAFSFPQAPEADRPARGPRRAASLNLAPTTPERVNALERRSASTLPSFSFNARDTSGRADSPAAASDDDTSSLAPSHRSGGHRRGASELVGGHNRAGGSIAYMSVSPTKGFVGSSFAPSDNMTSATGSPAKKRGHAHRRSSAMSSHDLSGLRAMNDANNNATSDSESSSALADPFTSESQTPPASAVSFPVARRVGFSSNIEFIPRPLSTISSEAESISSGTGRRSPSNSITSPRQSGLFNPVAKRKSRSGRSSLSEVEFASQVMRPSYDETASGDNEYPDDRSFEEYRPDSSPVGFSTAKRLSWVPDDHPNINRRSSEPTLSLGSLQKPRRSSVSLREPLTSDSMASFGHGSVAAFIKRKSSASRVKAWASSVIGRKDKKSSKKPVRIDLDLDPQTGMITQATQDGTPMSEADLEELFSQDPFSQNDDDEPVLLGARIDVQSLTNFRPVFDNNDDDDNAKVIDLDAVMSSAQTPSRDGRSPGFGARRAMHSSRTNREFTSPGNIYHRRAESAPALTPFDYPSSASSVHSPMADVFEEDEDEENIARIDREVSSSSIPAFTFPQAPLSPRPSTGPQLGQRDDLGISHAASSEPRTPTTAVDASEHEATRNASAEISRPIEVVQPHEEPRAGLASDAASTANSGGPSLAPRSSSISLLTSSLFNSSAFSTPDIGRRQKSFDMPRVTTSASSAADTRTLSSMASERPDTRPSVDDVPSLTSSRSTMLSAMPPRRNMPDRPSSVRSRPYVDEVSETRRRKRSSIQGLAKLMSSSFGESKTKFFTEHGNASSPDLLIGKHGLRKRENRLSKLMFWRSKGAREDVITG